MAEFHTDPGDRRHPVIVHEHGRQWIDSLSGGALGPATRVRHSVTVAATVAILRAERRSTLVVAAGSAPVESLELLLQASLLANRVVPIVILRSVHSDLELVARELGAIAVFYEPITGREIARWVRSIIRLQPWGLQSNSVGLS